MLSSHMLWSISRSFSVASILFLLDGTVLGWLCAAVIGLVRTWLGEPHFLDEGALLGLCQPP